VRLRLRLVALDGQRAAFMPARVVSVRAFRIGSEAASLQPEFGALSELAMPDDSIQFASEWLDVELALPAGTGDEVALVLTAGGGTCGLGRPAPPVESVVLASRIEWL
jgi:hypothetical protein